MHKDSKAEAFGLTEKLMELGLAQKFAIDIATNLHASKSGV